MHQKPHLKIAAESRETEKQGAETEAVEKDICKDMCTLVMKTLVMLSGLSPSGLGGPSSCSPSPFSKLCRNAGLRMCWSTFERGQTHLHKNSDISK